MKKQTLILLFIFIIKSNFIIAQTDKIVMNNYLKAEKILQNAINKVGGKEKFKTPVSFNLVGKKYFFGQRNSQN